MKFYLLDRITEIIPGKIIRGIKCWSLSDEVFQEHFPGFPIVPGVYQIESMAQAIGILIEESYPLQFPDEDNKIWATLSIVQKAKFRKFIIPGDKMEISAELSGMDKYHARGKGKIKVDGELRATAELSFFLIKRSEIPNKELETQRTHYYHLLKDFVDKVKNFNK